MAGLNGFVNVTTEDIAQVLEPNGFVKMDLPDAAEWAFSKKITFENAPTIVRVYTGILKATNQSRGAGQDAIRVCLGRKTEGARVRIFKTLPTVRRIGTWRIHLLDRVTSIGDGLADIRVTPMTEADLLDERTGPVLVDPAKLKCPTCGARMVGPKPGKLGPFYGCSRFPHCRGLINARDLTPEMIAAAGDPLAHSAH